MLNQFQDLKELVLGLS